MKKDNDEIVDFVGYNPATGEFTWVQCPGGGTRVGDPAGHLDPRHILDPRHGYRVIRFQYRLYQAHRVAWRIMFGYWPKQQIDHRDGNPLNNRIANLREATPTQNMRNNKTRKDSVSRLKGVGWAAHAGAWKAKIKIGNKQKHLGYFPTAEMAHEAYCLAAELRDSEFHRYA